MVRRWVKRWVWKVVTWFEIGLEWGWSTWERGVGVPGRGRLEYLGEGFEIGLVRIWVWDRIMIRVRDRGRAREWCRLGLVARLRYR